MTLEHIDDLKNILVKELKDENLNKKALLETWNVLYSTYKQDYKVTKEHLVNYYTTCLRYDSLKD